MTRQRTRLVERRRWTVFTLVSPLPAGAARHMAVPGFQQELLIERR